jgi:predicted membrane-bound mannosyltransferase
MTEKPATLDRPISLPQVTWESVAFVLILIASVLLHLTKLGDMALHHDESIHAWVTWRFLTGTGDFTCAGGVTSQTYCYDPVYHGPALYMLGVVSFFLFGDGDWQARLPQALAGIGLTLSVLWLKPFLGKRGTLLLAAIVSIAPTILYFTRFDRHDGLMLLWVFWIVVGFFRFVQDRDRRWLWLMATGIGLAVTTHELYYIIGFLFTWFVVLRYFAETAKSRTLNTALVALAGASVVLEAAILAGLWDGNLTESLNAGGLAFVLFFLVTPSSPRSSKTSGPPCAVTSTSPSVSQPVSSFCSTATSSRTRAVSSTASTKAWRTGWVRSRASPVAISRGTTICSSWGCTSRWG